MEEEVCRLRCKGEEDEGRHEDGSMIDPKGDVFINGVEVVEKGVAPIDPSSTLILEGGGTCVRMPEKGAQLDRPDLVVIPPDPDLGRVWLIGTAQASIIVGPDCWDE